MSEQNILATIDGVNITDADLDAYIANLPKEQQDIILYGGDHPTVNFIISICSARKKFIAKRTKADPKSRASSCGNAQRIEHGNARRLHAHRSLPKL